jgi:pimeloyl-ACP methyl ester carboxylesterase
MNKRLYDWQLRRFLREEAVQNTFVPDLYEIWQTSWPAFRDLVGSLFLYTISRARRTNLARLRAYQGRVRIIFGARDPYLNVHVAQRLHTLFPNSELFLLETGYHYVQVDEPEKVAQLILEMRHGPASVSAVKAGRPLTSSAPDDNQRIWGNV